jgi:hypothetical protein
MLEAMRHFVYQLVDRLAEVGLSRNRQFALLESPAGVRARRIHRHLRSIQDDLARHGENASLEVLRHDNGVEVRLQVAALKLVRTAFLTAEDLIVLARHAGPLPAPFEPFLPAGGR